jgi:DNA-binding response OmpR family regulator
MEPHKQYKRGNETILLVEGEKKIRETLKKLLENEGYTVIEAMDGADEGEWQHSLRRDASDLSWGERDLQKRVYCRCP